MAASIVNLDQHFGSDGDKRIYCCRYMTSKVLDKMQSNKTSKKIVARLAMNDKAKM